MTGASAAATPDPQLLAALEQLVASALRQQSRRPVVIGICGAQGSGKTTLVAALARRLGDHGLRCAALSLDDLYLGHDRRQELARHVHPLLATRGVPGTHDVAQGLALLDALTRGQAAALPRFDKARDDPALLADWPSAPSQCEVLLFEGWCLGAVAQPEHALAEPVNALEAQEDVDGVWRSYANQALAGGYQHLFARIDRLVLLAAPGWEVVARWREQQEAALRATAKSSGEEGSRIMSPAQVQRFIQHYERLTRHIMSEMPARADLVARLGDQRLLLALDQSGFPSRSR